ncbi:Histone-fold [Penicillium sp. IBT 35674x]|nr:Histone-fold [Penicillium sp. IBT 35674x]
MSSPPPYQTPTASLKRPSISSTTSQPILKKQRMHPLRQTSFPANLEPTERSFAGTSDAGSVTGSFTGSLGGTSADGIFAGAARGKKRGRKSKADKERERDDAMSTRTGDAGRFGSADAEGSVRGGMGGGRPADDGDDYDDDDDEGELLGREEGGLRTPRPRRRTLRIILVDAFNPIQSERYDLFKRAKLRKESLRRIVNHALSQSVPASVVTSVNGFTKVFAGEMIEKARTVQAEWADAHDQAARAAFDAEEAAAEKAAQAKAEAQAQEMAKRATPTSSGTPALGNGIKKESPDPSQAQASPKPGYNLNPTSSPAPSPVPLRPRREFRPPPNPHRGQLLPSHLREAQRRCKRDGEGGGVGFSGMSMDNLGVKGAFTWSSGSVGGRRLFR